MDGFGCLHQLMHTSLMYVAAFKSCFITTPLIAARGQAFSRCIRSLLKHMVHVVLFLSMKSRTVFGCGLEGGYAGDEEELLMSLDVLIVADGVEEFPSPSLSIVERQASLGCVQVH